MDNAESLKAISNILTSISETLQTLTPDVLISSITTTLLACLLINVQPQSDTRTALCYPFVFWFPLRPHTLSHCPMSSPAFNFFQTALLPTSPFLTLHVSSPLLPITFSSPPSVSGVLSSSFHQFTISLNPTETSTSLSSPSILGSQT